MLDETCPTCKGGRGHCVPDEEAIRKGDATGNLLLMACSVWVPCAECEGTGKVKKESIEQCP